MVDPTGLVICAAVLVAAAVFGAVRTARDGRLRVRSADAGLALSAAELGSPLGGRATLVQFSTTFCSSCDAARRLLGGLAAATAGVTHVEVDAEARPDLVARLGILRSPTVLVLDRDGRIVRRASGPQRRAEILAGIEAATGAGTAGALGRG
ncbi:thioredoxin family protein [Kitasatospora sp. NPDC048365]|uniref:thioredoxin family protein n=1 Tax=Kitasatospora sp. NPDC048365 TaxID=3364050 RepID=UPI0037192F02